MLLSTHIEAFFMSQSNELNINPISVEKSMFTIDKITKTLVCEASTIRFGRLIRLYKDAIDVGVILTNRDTMKTTRWYWEQDVMCNDDIIAWILKPCPESVRKCPSIADYTLHILND